MVSSPLTTFWNAYYLGHVCWHIQVLFILCYLFFLIYMVTRRAQAKCPIFARGRRAFSFWKKTKTIPECGEAALCREKSAVSKGKAWDSCLLSAIY